jgi:chorismate dehydratase
MASNAVPDPAGAGQYTLGAVSFLNAKPLVAGLVKDPRVRLDYAVPARLAERLCGGQVDAALIPVVDLLANPGLRTVSDACIASDGETLTVRVFARVPPHQISRLAVDGDSHTSVVLARLIWLELFGQRIDTLPFDRDTDPMSHKGVLLIGDKVVSMRPRGFGFEIDLGAVWRELTGLPFVYAVWAIASTKHERDLARLLSASRDVGIQQVDEIVASEAPPIGWPVEIARRYLREYLDYRLTERHRQGMDLFLRKAVKAGLLVPAKGGGGS